MIAFLIVNIILAALDKGRCVPRFDDSNDTWDRQTNFNNGNNNFLNNNNGTTYFRQDRWCGSRLVVYITHGVLIALFIPYFLLNILASREEREWEKGTHTTRGATTNAAVSNNNAARY